jgi:hypothetical protein
MASPRPPSWAGRVPSAGAVRQPQPAPWMTLPPGPDPSPAASLEPSPGWPESTTAPSCAAASCAPESPPLASTPPASATGVEQWFCEHTCPAAQVPQLSALPQLSWSVPHVAPALAHVTVDVHPQWFGVPAPPHVLGAAHAGPQLTVPPQPFGIVPQLSLAGQLVIGVQPQ